MLICKYTKQGTAAFIPHLDMLRHLGMAVRRAAIPVDFSEGYNPHMKIFFGQPLPIGTASRAEYFCLYTGLSGKEFTAKINENLPDGVRVSAAAAVEKDPNVSGLMALADYEVTFSELVPPEKLDRAVRLATGKTCVICYTAKGQPQQKDVRDLIHEAWVKDGALCLRLACGNPNLRADRLMAHLAAQCDLPAYDVTKTALYDRDGKNLDTVFFGEIL